MAEPAKPIPELTRHQSLVLDALAREENPASAYALLDQLRDEGLRAPQQIYRALEKLIDHGLVHRVESLNAFVACTHPPGHRHGLTVFAICDQCGHVDEFADTAIERRLKGQTKERAFRMNTAMVEVHGTCANCSGGASPGEDAAPASA
jgi:Fur family zinc uptake transcriptional regulator